MFFFIIFWPNYSEILYQLYLLIYLRKKRISDSALDGNEIRYIPENIIEWHCPQPIWSFETFFKLDIFILPSLDCLLTPRKEVFRKLKFLKIPPKNGCQVSSKKANTHDLNFIWVVLSTITETIRRIKLSQMSLIYFYQQAGCPRSLVLMF